MRSSALVLIAKYSAFAVIATVANLGVQRVILAATEGWYIAALIAGTLVGLAVKYYLDKRWIFFDHRRDIRSEARIFGLYAATGVGTTALFWGTETLFWFFWQTQTMREIGAIFGLTLGYVIKYNLDYRIVFRETADAFVDGSDGQHK